jgi:hypothetical protein
MQLRYRGNAYPFNPTIIDDMETRGTGHYRGRRVGFSYPRHIPVPQTLPPLTYRGVQYCVNAEGQVETLAPTIQDRSVAVAPQPKPVASLSRKVLPQEVAQVHQANIRRRLQQRLDAARNQGNEQLVHQLEVEMQQFA